MTPGDLNHVFFTSGGSEAVESALKLARQYFRVTGQGQKHKVIAREVAYHGTTMGALMATGLTDLRAPFEPFAQGGCHVPNTNSYHWPADRDPLWAAEKIRERIEFEGPQTVAAVILEPLQNAGGCIPPQEGYFQRVREICDEFDVLLISDEVICAWGRLGHYFGCERYGYQPDIITSAKALTSAYAPMGAMIASERLFEPFSAGTASFTHGFTFAGHPVAAAAAMANIDVYEREDLCGHVLRKEDEFRGMLDDLRDIPIVGDVRGAGYFHAIELVQRPGHEGRIHARRVRVAPPRIPLRRALPARPDLPRGRPGRSCDPAGAAADLRHGAVRGDHRRATAGSHRGGRPGREGRKRRAARRAPRGLSPPTDADRRLTRLGLRPGVGRGRRGG